MAAVTPLKSASSVGKSVSIVLSPETGVVRGEIHTPGAPPPSVKAESRRSRKSVPIKKKKKKRTEPLVPNEAAAIIQQAWRRHIDVQVYRYYRDLINFRCRGNPAMMLRCINPKEARLLDAAAGIHIKFRLAGAKFPPNIYYKIFTHRTIIDMCANSPKDYTKASTKRFAARDVHNRREQGSPNLGQGGGEVEKTGWYQREENNGWRLVSDRLILRADQDPITWESSRTKKDFQHSKLLRKEDVEKKKKRTKLEWMKKMYKEGMLQAQADDEGLNTLVEDATDGLMAQIENKGPDSVDDWEVDELLQWTSGLNFDDYQKSWKEIATSAGSETYIDERLQFKTSKQDPYEFTFTMRESLPSPPSPSRVTTAKTRSATTKHQIEDIAVN
ncbi:protein MFI-like [Lytechinus pictus]|uniref:protein MFI-like n=1 Tax=Lytechinus pictus TaxID=7653 RepID=UPI0030B9BCD6